MVLFFPLSLSPPLIWSHLCWNLHPRLSLTLLTVYMCLSQGWWPGGLTAAPGTQSRSTDAVGLISPSHTPSATLPSPSPLATPAALIPTPPIIPVSLSVRATVISHLIISFLTDETPCYSVCVCVSIGIICYYKCVYQSNVQCERLTLKAGNTVNTMPCPPPCSFWAPCKKPESFVLIKPFIVLFSLNLTKYSEVIVFCLYCFDV